MLTEAISVSRRWLEVAASFLYPEICQSCEIESATASQGYVCEKCRATVEFIKPPYCQRCGAPFAGEITSPFICGLCRHSELYFSHARGVVPFEGVVRDTLLKYKYNRALWIEPFFAELVQNHAGPRLRDEGWDLIVPVPLHPRKRAEREFNQAERLGRHLSRAAGVPMEKRALRRILPTRTQTRLSASERAENVRKAFAFKGDPARIQDRRIVLFDDVLTTGATASACARVLLQAGAREVCAWTLARGLLH
ncbi:MAG: ComF family protein [Verrucomicrobia subdivision 3 bacterium]|nr:ComF family protein [Limisphaerales bacterium]